MLEYWMSSAVTWKTALFVPAGDGRPPTALTTRSSESAGPQPAAAGAAKALSTTVPMATISLPTSDTESRCPDSGWFGGGGLVVPNVGSTTMGVWLDPTKQVLPKTGLRALIFWERITMVFPVGSACIPTPIGLTLSCRFGSVWTILSTSGFSKIPPSTGMGGDLKTPGIRVVVPVESTPSASEMVMFLLMVWLVAPICNVPPVMWMRTQMD